MVTEDRIRELAAAGMFAADIARETGVSRQRIHQIAKRAGITLLRWTPRLRNPAPSPTPRVVTGGICGPINQTIAGTIAEMLVAADLLARGWQVFLPAVRLNIGHDLVATRGSEVMTIEVRSATRRKTTGVIMRPTKANCPSTHYAWVLTGEPVVYSPDI
jgi:hypothetical protein